MPDTDAARAAMGPVETWVRQQNTEGTLMLCDVRIAVEVAREQDAALATAQQENAALREALERSAKTTHNWHAESMPTLGGFDTCVATICVAARTALTAADAPEVGG